MVSNKFITFDGRHGAGKSFFISKVSAILESWGYKTFVTREPTCTNLGTFAREAENKFQSETLVCLFAADRYEHILEIKHKMQEGYIVLCDRYIISAVVLQNMDNVEIDFILNVNKNIILPDISIILYADDARIREVLKNRANLSRLAQKEVLEGGNRYLNMIEIMKPLCKELIIYKNDYDENDCFFEKICYKIIYNKIIYENNKTIY